MRILGLDISTKNTGAVVIDSELMNAIYYENITHSNKSSEIDKLCTIHHKVFDIILAYNVQQVVVEDSYSGINRKTGIILARCHGVIYLAAGMCVVPLTAVNIMTAKKDALVPLGGLKTVKEDGTKYRSTEIKNLVNKSMKIAFDLPSTVNNDITDGAACVFSFLKKNNKNIKAGNPLWI